MTSISPFISILPDMTDHAITVVSGLPRSGTSMMMRMLEAGGIPPLTDGARVADSDNPFGYYELQQVKSLVQGDVAWLSEAIGKAIKVITPLLRYLPHEHLYSIIMMHRRMEEILASQRIMLQNRGENTDRIPDAKLAQIYEREMKKVEQWLSTGTHLKVLVVSYNELLSDPHPQLHRLNEFLGIQLNLESMSNVIVPELYRQRM